MGVSELTQMIREVAVACPSEHVFAALFDVERLWEFSNLTVGVRKGPGRSVEVGDTSERATIGEIADKLVPENAQQLLASLEALCETVHGS